MEGETELEGRLKKVRIKLIMIGICLIFLGVYSLIKEKKIRQRIHHKKHLTSMLRHFLEKVHRKMKLQSTTFLENSEKYGVKQSQNLYPVMNEKNILNEKIRISRELEKLKKSNKRN